MLPLRIQAKGGSVLRRARYLLPVLLAIVLLAGCGTQEQGGQPKEEAAAPETTADRTKAGTAAQERTTAKAKTTYGVTTAKTSQTASSPATSQGSSEKAGPTVNAETTVTVTRVVDGDTFEISPAIKDIANVRLIGVDTPETKKPNCSSQPYGAEASAFTTAQLQGQQVGLEFDVEKTDRYDRLLAYVYPSNGSMFNDTLLREGYAQLATFPPNVTYVERFQEAQAKARAAGLGLWGQPPEQLAQQTDRGNGIGGGGCLEKAAQFQPQPVPAAPPGGDVDCSDFGSSAEAYLPPDDPYKLDADGDGQACDSLR